MTSVAESDYRSQLLPKIQQAMSEKRFKHVLGVEKAAVQLAEKYGASVEKASIAALTHDYAKERSDQEFIQQINKGNYPQELLNYGNYIWHGLVGADFVQQELAINNQEILQAIRLHTTGAAEMSLLDKIIYVADYIEAGRDFPIVEQAREIAQVDLDQAVAFETQQVLLYLISSKKLIYPKTLETYNRWVVNL
ncbi:putative HD superfamily hydrolase involved in NAD metabolism [Enterococcus sp. PF1-24]|uniref:bis(5'-nucleosyl)-tetraphosphatase (symmetrical) YqeK n=1 Tax=unclassified Enterococcus TaxID=2608891 RepID=UPI0024739E3B|nr:MULTISPECIES: bis(5'-nucleosyl)-tetraphosphatase (symmetrical) YqeK [unclassified Enterococcus]MDH6365231.1 putative HD superfamily hydrolase involved in NAD metabolism [Enterococcus sp. PFB1-1]MDH6402332.1 putative HD superfamily hydrolase involved in NAD metabolism [Enterococcus sp. PF1-24]